MFYSVRIITAYDWLKAKAFGWVLNVARRLLKKNKSSEILFQYYLYYSQYVDCDGLQKT